MCVCVCVCARVHAYVKLCVYTHCTHVRNGETQREKEMHCLII